MMKNNWRKNITLAGAAAMMAAVLAIPMTAQASDDVSTVQRDTVREIIRQYMGLKTEDIKDLEVDLDDGMFEAEFHVNGLEFEYTISAKTGQVLRAELGDGDDDDRWDDDNDDRWDDDDDDRWDDDDDDDRWDDDDDDDR